MWVLRHPVLGVGLPIRPGTTRSASDEQDRENRPHRDRGWRLALRLRPARPVLTPPTGRTYVDWVRTGEVLETLRPGADGRKYVACSKRPVHRDEPAIFQLRDYQCGPRQINSRRGRTRRLWQRKVRVVPEPADGPRDHELDYGSVTFYS
jgi:hypothetical protein